MLQLPREPRAGDKLDASWGAQIVRFLRSITPRSGPGVLVKLTANGATFSGAGPGNTTSEMTHPFQVVDASTETQAKVRVVFGQVHSVTPTIGGDPLDADPDDPPLLNVENGVVYLAVVLDADDDYAITSASIHCDGTLPDEDATHGYITLATVTVDDGVLTAINQSVTHSLGHQKCGEDTHNFWAV